MKKSLFLFVVITVFCSCNIDEEFSVYSPKIIFENDVNVYSVKIGRTITISPRYENAENAVFTWSINDSVIGIEPELRFCGERLGENDIVLKVETEAGYDLQAIRIDVVELEIPTVSLAGAKEGFALGLHSAVTLKALTRQTSLPATYTWLLDGEKVGDALSYTFSAQEIGIYTLVFEARNDDGSDRIDIKIEVTAFAPISWEFQQIDYQAVAGRAVEVGPTRTQNLENAVFTFCLGDSILQQGEKQTWLCCLTKEGEYEIDVAAQIRQGEKEETLTQRVSVTVISAENLSYRAKTETSVAACNKVYEYTPAPGQFINELKTGGFDGTQTSPQTAASYAEKRLSEGSFVSLGGFGGYIVVGFDHSIDNADDYDFVITGNAYSNSSEPGIVWVMQDENGDGLPNDNWYELQGSETGKATTLKNYSVTYYRPSGKQMPVQWIDSEGEMGEIDYQKTSHDQDSYYPAWISTASYTLRGTRLEARNADQSGNGSYWIQEAYNWGYADNFGTIDRVSSDSKSNRFDISNAIDANGNSVDLAFIDFVKVQTAVNAKSGWLGELSTEVAGFYDYSMKKE